MITDNDIFLSMIAIDGSTKSGLKYRVSFSTNTAVWRSSFLSSTSSDNHGEGSCIFSASQNIIYSLTVFTVSNKVILFCINADSGSGEFSPFKFSNSISQTRGMILIDQDLYFIIIGNSISYLVIFNTLAKTSIAYSIDSTITIYRINITYDYSRLILIGNLNSNGYRSKVMPSQLAYDSYLTSTTYAMVDASIDYSYTFLSNGQILTTMSPPLTSTTYTESSVSLSSISSLNSDISFSCNSASFLTLVTNITGNASLPLSCSISGSTAISYSSVSAPNWVSLDAANRVLIVNTTGVSVGTTSTFTIKSVSIYPICDKVINLKVVSCNVSNCEICSLLNPNFCTTCNNGYYIYNNSASNNSCTEKESDLSKISSTSSIVTKSLVGAVAGMSAIVSVCSLSTPQGLWVTINQFQLILLLLLTNSHIPKSIVTFISGLKETTCSLSFIPIDYVFGLSHLINWFSFDPENKNLNYLGLYSGSTIINSMSFICVILLIIIFHIIITIICKIFQKKIRNKPKLLLIFGKFYQLFTFTIYLRIFLESNQFLLLSSFSELKMWNASHLSGIISLVIAFIVAIFLNLIYNAYFYSLDYRFMPFKEFFSDLKNEGLPRLYSTILLIRRAIFSIFLAMGNSLSSICLTIPMCVIQTLYLAMMVLIRPYKSVKDNLLEIINEVFYFTLVTLLIHFNSDSNWNEPVEMAYFCLILANSFIIISLIIGSLFVNIIIKLRSCCGSSTSESIKPKIRNTNNFQNFERESSKLSKLSINKNSIRKQIMSEIDSQLPVNIDESYKNKKTNREKIINFDSQNDFKRISYRSSKFEEEKKHF